MIIDDNGTKREITEQEFAEMNTVQNQINILIQNLNDTDYQFVKWKEGWLTDKEYEPMRMQRQAWRDEINELEKQL